MLNLIPEYYLIDNTLKKSVSFKEACFKVRTSTYMSSTTSKSLAYNCKITLSHYFSLTYQIFSIFDNLNIENKETRFLLVYLTHIKYLKDDLNELNESFVNEINELHLNLDENDFTKLLNCKEQKLTDENKLLSLSLKYELPLFLLEILMKKYKKEELLSIIKNLHGKERHLYINNTENEIVNDKLSAYPCHSIASLNLLLGKIDNSSQLIEEKQLIKTSLPLLLALSNIKEVFPFTKIIFSNLKAITLPYSSYLLLKNKTNLQIISFVKNSLYYRKVKEYNTSKNLSTINAPIELIKTYQSYKSSNIVITFGSSSISTNCYDPSILVKFNSKDIENEKKTNLTRLLDTCPYVENDGYLIYINDSLLDSVNEDVCKEFLNKKSDFYLVKDENVVSNNDVLPRSYYAIFKRREK